MDRFVSDQLENDLSRSRLQKLIADGFVHVDGKPAKAAGRLRAGWTVTVRIPPTAPTTLIPEDWPLDVLFEDRDVIAVAKPAGVPVHPGAGHSRGTLVHALLAHCGDLSGIGGVERPGIVHRLDKDTSGVLIVAKNDFAHEGLSVQFAKRMTRKTYRAFVFGCPVPTVARVETLIGRHPTQRKRFSSKVTVGKTAVTEYRVVRSGGGISEVEVEIETGRTHQIRVHFSDRGHPIVADGLYGGRRWSRIHDENVSNVARGLGRQSLHAEKLVVRHPRSGDTLELCAALPMDLARLFEAVANAE